MIEGATGKRFASSTAGGDDAIGTLTSPSFVLKGARMTMKLGGLVDPSLRVELDLVDRTGVGAVVRTATVPPPGGPMLRSVGWDIHDLEGLPVRLVLTDESASRGGYLLVDDVWVWER